MIVVCADDYGLATGVCAGIEELIEMGRLSATSAMTGMPAWRRHGATLRRLVASRPADVGLHLTLTDQRPVTPLRSLAVDGRLPPVEALIRRALARRLPRAELAAEINAQLDAFEEIWGAPPDFVDGHQHAHVLPGVRDLLVEILAERYPGRRIWLRDCAVSPLRPAEWRFAPSKALVVGALSRPMRRTAAKAGFATNRGFAGLYDFSETVPYRDIFRASIAKPEAGRLVHCHPGHVDRELEALDRLLSPRTWELAYLASDACGDDLEESGARIAPFFPRT